MGVVWKARHHRLNRICALKVIHKERLSQNPEAASRFQREAQAAAQLHHNNVVIVYDFDQVGDTYFIAMEYVEGIDLHQLVKDERPAEHRAGVRIRASGGAGAAARPRARPRASRHQAFQSAGDDAQQQGHAGFHLRPTLPGKPGTPASPRRRPRLPSPFGRWACPPGHCPSASSRSSTWAWHCSSTRRIRRRARSGREEGTLMGTPDFIAPEQAMNSHTVDIRADLYSLGCTLYFLLTGRAPFAEYPLIKKLMMHQTTDGREPIEEVRPDVPPAVAAIVKKLLAKDAARSLPDAG